MKTNIFVPNFFLAHKDQIIQINAITVTVIGRKSGDVILEDDQLLSNVHCELKPHLLEVYIKDLESTNGVFVNKLKLTPFVEQKLCAGDLVTIGSRDYIFFDNEADAKKIMPKPNKRKHPRPKNLYTFENLITFYEAPTLFRGIYLVLLLATLASFMLHLQLDTPVPENLTFLSTFYADNIIASGLRSLFYVWSISLVHSFLMVLYFNRNPIRKGLSLVGYFLIIFYFIDFKYGPLGGVKNYFLEREFITINRQSDKAIVNLLNTLSHKEQFNKSYNFTKRKLVKENQIKLSKDYKVIQKKFDQLIITLK